MRSWWWIAIAVGAGCGGRTIGDDFEAPEDPASGAAAAGGGGTSGAGAGGAGGSGTPPPDPIYPRVEWENGAGFTRSCPRYQGTWGFLCWHFDGRNARLCGDGNCNACSCAIPCGGFDEFRECPPSASGIGQPECIKESPNTDGTCLLTCDNGGPCPPGMTCSPYPGLSRRVCMWVTGR